MDEFEHIPLIENADDAEKEKLNLIISAVNSLGVFAKQVDVLTKATVLLLEKIDSIETKLLTIDSTLDGMGSTLSDIDDKLFNIDLNGIEVKSPCLYNLDDLHHDINAVEDAINNLSL